MLGAVSQDEQARLKQRPGRLVSLALGASAMLLVFGTGVSGCGDGVLQTAEVAKATREAGYPPPVVATYADFLRKVGADGKEPFLGHRVDVANDTVGVSPAHAQDPYAINVQVVVDADSGAGVALGSPIPTITTVAGKEIGKSGGWPEVLQGRSIRRVRHATVCNATVTAFETAESPDTRFERLLRHLTARC
jgi:hypothetical protein